LFKKKRKQVELEISRQEVNTQKSRFWRDFQEKTVFGVSKWVWRMKNEILNKESQ